MFANYVSLELDKAPELINRSKPGDYSFVLALNPSLAAAASAKKTAKSTKGLLGIRLGDAQW